MVSPNYLRWFAATFQSGRYSASLGSRACLRSRNSVCRGSLPLIRWRAPETREQNYLETLIARETTREVQLYQLGPMLLERYRSIFNRLYGEDRSDLAGVGLPVGAPLPLHRLRLVVLETIVGGFLGDMTMYLMVFRQGQTTFSSALSSMGNVQTTSTCPTFEFLEQNIPKPRGHCATRVRFLGTEFAS